MSRKPPSIHAFGPEVMTALLEGSRRELELRLTYIEAVMMRMRMHQLRARMREDKHPLADIVQRARLTIHWPADTPEFRNNRGVRSPKYKDTIVTLRIQPQDLGFREALAKAGVKVEDEAPLPENVAPLVSSADQILEDWSKSLDELGLNTEVKNKSQK